MVNILNLYFETNIESFNLKICLYNILLQINMKIPSHSKIMLYYYTIKS